MFASGQLTNRANVMVIQPKQIRRGLSLIEVVASTMIVGMMAVATLNSLGAATKSSNSIGNRAVACRTGRRADVGNHAAALQRSDGSTVFGRESGESAIAPSAFDDVDDYDGWNASPPQYRDGTTIPDRTNWRQTRRDPCVVPTNPRRLGHRSRREAHPRHDRIPELRCWPINRRSAPIPTRSKRWPPDEIEQFSRGRRLHRRAGTALVVALLGMTALIGQRIQNRMIVASADIRQAQLNANTAVELALLTMKQDTNWRRPTQRQLVCQSQHDGRHVHAKRHRSGRRQPGEQRRRPDRRDRHRLQRRRRTTRESDRRPAEELHSAACARPSLSATPLL